MWFVFVGVGLLITIVSGLYVRRRLTQALVHFAVRPRRIRIVRWAMVWFLFGFPLLMIVTMLVAHQAGWEARPSFDGPVLSWLLVIPFIFAVLVTLQALPWVLVLELVRVIVRRRHGAARERDGADSRGRRRTAREGAGCGAAPLAAREQRHPGALAQWRKRGIQGVVLLHGWVFALRMRSAPSRCSW